MLATKNIGVAHQKQIFQFYYAVAKYKLLEKYGKKQNFFLVIFCF